MLKFIKNYFRRRKLRASIARAKTALQGKSPAERKALCEYAMRLIHAEKR